MPSRLLGGGARGPAAPVPVLGAELIVNGGFDADANWTPGPGWTIADGVANKAAGATANLSQIVLVAGTWYQGQMDIVSLAAGTLSLLFGNTAATGTAHTSAGAKTDIMRASSTTASVRSNAATAGTIDNVSFRAITLASMFSTRPYTTHATTKARVTVVAGTRAGVVCNLDSATVPSSFVIASHDGTTARLTSCLAGVYTEKISAAVAYSAGAFVEVRRLAGTDTYQLYYAGNRIGADQTITGMTGTLAGMFNTFSQNQLSDFSCVPA